MDFWRRQLVGGWRSEIGRWDGKEELMGQGRSDGVVKGVACVWERAGRKGEVMV